MVKLAENAGFGLDKIESNWKLYNQSNPLIVREFDSTLLKLTVKDNNMFSKKWNKNLNDDQEKMSEKMSEKVSEKMSEKMSEKILELIQKNNQVTIAELSVEMDVTTRTIERWIDKLKQQNLLQRIGPAKGGRWEIIK